MMTDYNRSESDSEEHDDSISFKVRHQVSKQTKSSM